MSKRRLKGRNKKGKSRTTPKPDAISYHLRCARTANGLSHFVMYGDAPKDRTPL